MTDRQQITRRRRAIPKAWMQPIKIRSGDRFEDMVRAYACVVTDAGINPLDEIRLRLSAALEAGDVTI